MGVDGFLCSGALVMAFAPLGRDSWLGQALVIAAALVAGLILAWRVHRHRLGTRNLMILLVVAFLGWPVAVAAAAGVSWMVWHDDVQATDNNRFAGFMVVAVVVAVVLAAALAPAITAAVTDLLNRHEQTSTASWVRVAALTAAVAGVAMTVSGARNNVTDSFFMLLLMVPATITAPAVVVIADILEVRQAVVSGQISAKSSVMLDEDDAGHGSGPPQPQPPRLSGILSRVAFALMAPLGLIRWVAILGSSWGYTLGQSLLYATWWLIPVVGLSYLAWRSPRRAGPVLTAVTILAIAWNVAELAGVIPLAADLAAPTGAGALLGVGVALSFLGLRRSLLAGLLLLAVGLTVPVTDAALAAIWAPGAAPYDGLHMPFGYWVRWLTVVGAVFVLAGILNLRPRGVPDRNSVN